MPEPSFAHLACRTESGTLVLTFQDTQITGDELADAIREELLAALDHFGPTRLVLDFANVQYLSSAGFRPLLGLHRKITERGCRMMFANLHPDIAEVFTVTRLLSPNPAIRAPFQAAPDVPSAIARLKHHSSHEERGVLVITITEAKLHGEELAETLMKELLETVQSSGKTLVVLDMKQVESISTPCMRPLLSLRSHLKTNGGRICLCNLSSFVSEVLTVTRLIAQPGSTSAPLEHAADVASAVNALAS